MSSQELFATLVFVSLPAALLYPLVYGFTSPWWTTWIGRALLIKAVGVAILLTISALFQFLGPEYPGRDVARFVGMVLVTIGTYTALFALVAVLRGRSRRDRTPSA